MASKQTRNGARSNPGSPLRVVSYVRVSTQEQAENGLGADVQREAIREWAADRGHEIVVELADEGESGSLAERDDLGCALRAIRGDAAEGIVVYRLDRLSRDLILQEQLIAEIWRHGSLFSTSAAEASVLKDDPDDPTRKLIRRIIGAVNEFEKDMIVLRLRNGRRHKRKQGGYAGGFIVFGFRNNGGTLEVDPGPAAVVAWIFELASRGVSPGEIARRLDGTPTPQGGKAWSRQAIHGILRNERYVGPVVNRRRFNTARRALKARAS